ncbi:FAD-dependent oxidoreductase [Halovenus sp. WSH3]|uniref:FAD-dependent oxidoreductase n=1 Tax=Halovenus carboxidivorans TaxID=2692199 RepID=A0A6B0T416_9EURY|nr:FAD-dependent oxidoreductase [Halovenus carboxidivorans]MXR51767.1 FAD-dependent oxidoreductase [Halovenus carboxidivorans]
MSDPFVVVGGDAAGLSAASKCKREDPDRDVIVYEKSEWISYAHCGMPYYVKGEVDSIGDLLSLSPAEVRERGVDLHRNHEVVEVDPERQTVSVEGADGTFEQPYDDLLIATGARAVTEPIDGTDLDDVFTMHHMHSAAALRALLTPPEEADDAMFDAGYVDLSELSEYVERDPPETVAVVGGGYVGVEMAEAFRGRDLDTHLYQRSDRPAPPFGEAVGDEITAYLDDAGVDLHLNTEVEALAGDGSVERVVADDGAVEVDLVVVGIGIRPNAELVAETGVELGGSGAIVTDEYGRTAVEGIYAAGDCAENRHTVTGENDWVPLGLTANRAGRAIGQTVAGEPAPVGEIAGTAVLKAFDLECGRTGIIDHDRAEAAGFDPVSETITAGSRSGYYPGNAETTVTLTADRESGRLLGGTIAGEDRAAIRIDTLATALHEATTVEELERFDLAYAPPFSPVWDPILVAAKVLDGTLSA